jgi:DNA (cytosine-5)-methyltransferase 1
MTGTLTQPSLIEMSMAEVKRRAASADKTLRELVVDNFAGGGGASTGIAWAIGRDPDYAINHDAAALAMHRANHSGTVHLCEDVWRVKPLEVTGGAPVGLAWFSPDCRHFSRAKGAKPVERRIRGLAWVAVKWAKAVRPRMIILENVREFETWGPLIALRRGKGYSWTLRAKAHGKNRVVTGPDPFSREGRAFGKSWTRKGRRCTPNLIPNPDKKGQTFRRFVGYLKAQGYKVEWRVLDAADYGAPTHRRRLFLVARCDGKPIIWPGATHGDPKKPAPATMFAPKLKPWHTAAECIDWSIPMKSIFDRKKPLAEKTLRRIAMGIGRYVLNAADPFVVQVNHGGDEFRGQPVDEPLRTVSAKHGFGVVLPHMVSGYGEREGQDPRTREVDRPAPTVVPAAKHSVVAAHVTRFFGDVVGAEVDQPLPTITAKDHHGQVAALLTKFRGDSAGHDLNDPCPTITSGEGARRPAGAAHALGLTELKLAPFIAGVGGRQGQSPERSVERPFQTITGKADSIVAAPLLVDVENSNRGGSRAADRPMKTITALPKGGGTALGAAALARFNHGEKQWNGVGEPLGTITSQGNKFGLVVAFLVKYYGTAIGAYVDEPLPTATAKARFGIVLVRLESGEVEQAVMVNIPGRGRFLIADIYLRMFTPRELANCQGFPPDYIFTDKTLAKQVARIGNSVPPHLAEAMCRANYAEVAA